MPSPPPRPTLRVIAKEVGLSLAATSMALRNHPRISLKTRNEVQAAARRLGYHPDAKLAALMQHLRLKSDVEYRETLAYVSSYATHRSWSWMPQHDYFLGAAEYALSSGYRLDVFHLGQAGMTPARMSRLLSARAIRGLLIGGFDQLGATLPLKWEKFSSIAFDYSLASPALHRITSNYYLEMISTLRRLEAEGCTRIGLNARSTDDVKVRGLWHSAYLLFQEGLPRSRRIPINSSMDGRAGLDTWLIRHKPDAIISAGACDFPTDYERVPHRTAPNDVRYINMNLSYADSRSRGIDKLIGHTGRLACEHVIAQLQRNESGLPVHPQVIAVEGAWVDDFTSWKRERDKWRKATIKKISEETGMELTTDRP